MARPHDAEIRPARRDDLDAVERLENRAFSGDKLSRRSLRSYVAHPTAAFLVLERNGELVGDALVAFRKGASSARLYSLAIDPDATGHGYGRRLLAAAEEAVARHGRTRMTLEVRADNRAALALYRSAGYQEFAAIPDYYEDGETALRFAKDIAPDGSGARSREG